MAISLVVSLDRHAHDVRQAPQAARAEQARAMACFASLQRGIRLDGRRIRPQPALGAAPPAAHARASCWAPCAWRSICTSIIPKGFFPQQDTGRLSGNGAERRGYFLSRRCSRSSINTSTIIQDRSGRGRGDGQHRRAVQSGVLQHHAEAARGAQGQRRSGDQPPAAASWPACPEPRFSSRPCRTCRSAAAPGNAQFQYTLQGDNFEDLLEWAPRVVQSMKAIPGLLRRQYRPAEPRPAKRAW